MKERDFLMYTECIKCGKAQLIRVNRDDFEEYDCNPQLRIQDIFPYLTSEERELMISGLCGKCFDKIFSE